MIPTVQIGLHTRASAAQSPPADHAAAPGFLAELAAQDDKPAPDALGAEACLVAGLMAAALQPAPHPAGHADSAENSFPAAAEQGQSSGPIHMPLLTSVKAAAARSGVAIDAASPIGGSASALGFQATEPVPPTDKSSSVLPAVAADRPPVPPALEASTRPERPAVSPIIPADHPDIQISLPDLATEASSTRFDAAKPALPAQGPTDPDGQDRAAVITEPAPLRQQTAAQGQFGDVQQRLVLPLSPPHQHLPAQPMPLQAPVLSVAALQPSATPPAPPEPLTLPNLAELPPPSLAAQVAQDDAAPAPLPPRMSTAESAWQTFLHRDVPQTPQHIAQVSQPQTRAAGPATATAQIWPTAQVVEVDANTQPQMLPALAATPQLPQPSPRPAPAPPTAHLAEVATNPTPDPVQVATPPMAAAEHTAPPRPDPIAPPASAPPAPAPLAHHQAAPIAPLHTPAPVSAQLLHHSTAAKTGGVDVLLQPEELGHVKFQIQQQGDSVRILLSAERPETVDLLRRHADQLLQEFRQAGFSQASLSFGQWGGDQQRPPAPPFGGFGLVDAETDDPPAAPRPQQSTPSHATGHGLHLRL